MEQKDKISVPKILGIIGKGEWEKEIKKQFSNSGIMAATEICRSILWEHKESYFTWILKVTVMKRTSASLGPLF